jgi:uncharacterized repeat protein (TIGR02543 family)
LKLAVRTTSTALAVVATAGASTLFLGVAPASAATEACGAGTLIAPGLCEQSYTSGTASFTPTAQMTKLEVLLVGAGGSGADQLAPNTNGYAAAGGGGQVKIVDFSAAAGPLTVTVPAPGAPGGVTDGTTNATVANGQDAAANGETGGTSGSGYVGATGISTSTTPYGGGGGAAGSPSGNANGGAGVVVSNVAAGGSLFNGDARCFGGGGAIGVPGIQGIPGCGGGGAADATGTILSSPIANSGGGGGGLNITQTSAARSGAAGLVVIRWTAAPLTLNFNVGGHGIAPSPQAIAALTAGIRPADPVADGFTFQGWYTDAALTIPADFSVPLSASTTFYAKWLPTLAATGGEANPVEFGAALAVLAAGIGLTAAAYRRRRLTD